MSTLKVSAARRDSRLVVEVEGDNMPAETTDLQDRVGALDGTVTVVRGPGGRVTIRADIPCESLSPTTRCCCGTGLTAC